MCQMSKHIDQLVDIDGVGFSSRFNKKKSKKTSRPLENIIPQRITKAEKQQVIRRNFERSRKDDTFYHFSEDAEIHNIKSPYKTNRLHTSPRLDELKIGIKSPYRKTSFASTIPTGLLSPLNPNCITPHKDQLSLNTRLDHDNQIENQSSIVHTIFIALFGKNEVKCSPFGFRRHYYNPLDDDEDDDEEDENDAPNNKNNIQIEPVDETWFKSLLSTQLFSSPAKDSTGKIPHPSSSSSSSFHSNIKKKSPNQIEFPIIIKPQQILSTYMNTSFVRILVNELCHEDDRFSSPRVSVLQALYKQCPHLRHTISQSLYEVTYTRYLRCCITQSHSSSLEVDHNRLASIGLLDYLSVPPVTHTTSTSPILQDTLVQSTAMSLCTHATRPCPSSVTSNPPPTPSLKPLMTSKNMTTSTSSSSTTIPKPTKTTTATTPTTPIVRDHDGSVLELLRLALSIELSSLPLPTTTTTTTTMSTRPDDSEDSHMSPNSLFPSSPPPLAQKQQLLLLPTHPHHRHHQNSQPPPTPETPETNPDTTTSTTPSSTSTTSSSSSIDFLLRVAMNVLRCYGSSLGSVGEHSDKPELLAQLLLCFESLLQFPGMITKTSILLCNQWPKLGQDFECASRRIAYVRVAHLILQHSPPLPMPIPCVTCTTGKQDIKHTSELTLPKLLPRITTTTNNNNTTMTTLTAANTNIAILTKIINTISSSHFKLAIACLNVCSDPLVLDTYLLSPSCRTQLEILVDALRVNRSHWHHLVVHSSEQLFDILLERME